MTRLSLAIFLVLGLAFLVLGLACSDNPEPVAAPADATVLNPSDAGATPDLGPPLDATPADGITPDDAATSDTEGEPDGGVPGDIQLSDTQPPDDSGALQDTADTSPPAPVFLLGTVPEDPAAFDQGVRSGDPASGAITLLTRYSGEAPNLRVLVLAAEGAQEVPVIAAQTAVPNDGGFARVHITAGLSPNTGYRFVFVADDANQVPVARSRIGSFVTAPAPDALVPVTFGGASCSKQKYKPYGPLDRAAEDGLAFMVLAGDTTYADPAKALPEYRAKWAESLLDPSYLALMADTPVIATWDDHEVANNWDPQTIDPAQLEAATQAFFEHIPIREQNGERVIWRRLRWGRAIDIFVLDCRSERQPSTILSADPIYISKAQLQWLKEGLLSSDAIFKLVVNSVPITEMPPIFVSSWDRWQGYWAQRQELLDAVAGQVDNLIWLSGDFHFPATTHVGKKGSPAFEQREILMGPVAHIINPLWLAAQGDQLPWAADKLNYTRFSVDPLSDPPSLYVEFIEANGEVFHAEEILAKTPAQ